MKKKNRAIVVVLDSLGVGELPDAAQFGDAGCHTLLHILARMPDLALPNLRSLGLLRLLGAQDAVLPQAGWGKMAERSRGKDTTTGHWELSGLVLDKPFPTFPHGFPEAFLERFSQAVGRPCIGNCTASGTEIIQRLGDEAVRRGALIVYTSADSVFQVAAHEEVVPLSELYAICQTARGMLTGDLAVGRVIARPFVGGQGQYVRTANRRDFSLEPAGRTMLDALQAAGRDVLAVGKISDIFAGRGITESFPTHGNEEGERALLDLLERDFSGLLFVNLVDFDMLYGHRRDAEGYGRALEHFDRTLGEALRRLRPGDLLAVTGDHGCDPTFRGTDHTREYVPLLLHGGATGDLGVRTSFSDLAATVCRHLGVAWASGEAIE
ncbi:MAG TPA: phosphopentomutase [Candidatus Spyradocola merdavium]|nr:phosphopentomutase [Candidatus Spyradocola merdavium]